MMLTPAWSQGHARVPISLSVEAANRLTQRQNKANPSLATRSKRLHTGHQRTILPNYISGKSLLRVHPWIRLWLSPAGGEVWKWSCCFSGSNKKPNACFYHHQHGGNKTDELKRVSRGCDVLALPRPVGNKCGGGEQNWFWGRGKGRPIMRRRQIEALWLPPSRCGAANQDTADFNINT